MTLEQSMPGRTVAYMMSDVRPQVSGILQERLFTEGQQVEAGQVLYQIDPKPYQAILDNARAELVQAEAAVLSARPRAERYRSLAAANAISQQDSDDASATLKQNEAAVVAAQAAVKAAKINLDYTRITAPIGGRISTSAYTPGALVTANQEATLTTIQQLDPIYIDVTQTSAQLLALRRQIDSGTFSSVNGKTVVRVVLEDGSTYAHSGTLEFVGTSVEPDTGNVTLRIVAPNPEAMLLPGAYVRAVLPMAIHHTAIVIPQTSVTRNTAGEAIVRLVGSDDKVFSRVVQLSEAMKDQWLVASGLEPGERLIVSGASQVRDGDLVAVQENAESATDAPVASSAPSSPAGVMP